jgi:hypothetical protein
MVPALVGPEAPATPGEIVRLETALRCNSCSGFSNDELRELTAIAALYADANGLFMRIVDWAGGTTETALKRLPVDWRTTLHQASGAALQAAYHGAYNSQGGEKAGSWLNELLSSAQGEAWHQSAAALSGVLGGLGGFATTLIDLPVTTTLIMRSIQQIAAGYGEDITTPEVRNQCLIVFALGGPLPDDDDQAAGLWATRLALTGQAVAALIRAAAPRLGIVVGEKLLAQAVPILGALAGGTINSVYAQYYQTMAHVHFRLRRLERTHDVDQVRSCFEQIVRAMKAPHRAAG